MDPEARQILEDIRREFAGISRGDAVTLHETQVIDRYGSATERQRAREMDTDSHWSEVRGEWIKAIRGTGGFGFLDDAGFRYYLPAYMSYWLRTGEEPDSLAYYIAGRGCHRYQLFSTAQRETIARFVKFVLREPSSSKKPG